MVMLVFCVKISQPDDKYKWVKIWQKSKRTKQKISRKFFLENIFVEDLSGRASNP